MTDDLYWYFAAKDCRLRYGDNRIAKVGTVHEVEGEPELCRHGLHASKRALDALRRGAGPVAFRVRLGGKVVHGDEKSAAQIREYVAGGENVTPTLVEFACCIAEAAMLLAEQNDPRSWEAIEAARAYMRGEIDLTALRTAANAAAYAAANANAAAYAAANAAAYAAYAAAYAAYAAYADAANANAANAAKAAYAAYADAANANAAYAAKAEINDLLELMLAEVM